MILIGLIVVPFIGGILAWFIGRATPTGARVVSLIALGLDVLLGVILWIQHIGLVVAPSGSQWLVSFDVAWIPQFGISLHFALDGLSLVLLLLNACLGIVAVLAAWNEVTDQVGQFHFHLLWVLAAMAGVFLALDLFLFYFFWEVMLIPMFFLIALWGSGRRVAAAVKFFIFTQVGGLLMLVAIVGLYVAHGRATGTYTFEYTQLLGTTLTPTVATLFMLGFFVGFGVKLPVILIHSWLPDAYTGAPTAGSIILASLMAKTAAYGMLRFTIPLFPKAAADFAPIAMTLAVVGILYGAFVAFGQTDAKRLLAFSSLSHMGLILLGIFAFSQIALQGVVLQIVCHGIVLAALFLLIGGVEARTGSRDLSEIGGLWANVPRLGGLSLLFALALMGLPGLGTFLGEFLILIGTFSVSRLAAIVAALGMITSVIYALWLIQRVFHGERTIDRQIPDLRQHEGWVLAFLVALIVWLGLYPQPVFQTTEKSITNLQQVATAVVAPPSGLTVQQGGRR